MRFEELPPEIRVKLHEGQDKRLWNRVEKIGISEASEETGYSRASIYNWRSKDLFLPADFVSEFLDVREVKKLKGGGRSLPMVDVSFPIQFSDELLTRIDASVKVNSEGIPMYQTNERSLLERFAELIDRFDVPHKVYNRELYELRYPKYFQRISESEQHQQDFAALVDEVGEVNQGFVEARGEKVDIGNFAGKLYSREKSLELALQNDDEEQIKEIMVEEAGKVREALQ